MATVFPSDNTSPNDVADPGFAGQIADAGLRYCGSFFAEAPIVAGSPVKRGTAKETQVEPFEAADVPTAAMFAGVAVLSTSRPYDEDGDQIAAGDSLSVMRLGVIYMNFSEAVTAGEQVGITLASGLLTGIPQGTAAGAITTGIVVLPGLRIVQTTGAAGVARVEVNLFGSQDAATVGSL